MSKLKFSENIFLEVAEFNRFQKFLDEDGFKRHFLLNTDNFGLVRQANIPNLGTMAVEDNFYVSKSGTPFNQVTVNKGIAIDANGNLILNSETVNLIVPSDSYWYWVKIKYQESSIEKGLLTVDALGNVTGLSTEFTKILRGQPNFPSKIKFTNTVNGNADEYEVVKVIDDNTIIIQGDFNPENNLKYSVVGTFTPGFVVDESNKNIYRYDSCEITLEKENVLNQPPTFILNSEFFIARVRNNGVNLSLQDKRVQWWQTEAVNSLKTLDRNLQNPLIGVENVKWDIKTSTRAKNWVELTWGFRFKSWTLDTSSKRISILIGNGGVYKDTSFFNNGDFDGWRLYSRNGKFQNIIDSIKTGTQIVITLDVLNPEDYLSDDLLFACPPYEEIEIKVASDGNILDTNDINGNSNITESFPYPNIDEIHNFSINTKLARFQIPVQKGCYNYNLTYRYKIFNDYSDWLTFPDDEVGFYKEKSFDIYGNLKIEPTDRERRPYAGHVDKGFITICEDPYSFDNFQDLLNTGDLFGVNTTQFSGADPLINLRVTKDKRYQHFLGSPAVFVLTSDIYINLSSFKDATNLIPCREGNTFYLHIEQWLDLATFRIRIVENYINPTSFDLIKEIDQNDACYIKNNSSSSNGSRKGMMITCTFNEKGHWIAQFDSDTTVKGTVRMFNNVPDDAFNEGTNKGMKPGYFGWQILTEMNDTFPLATNTIADVGSISGSHKRTLDMENMPKHKHQFTHYPRAQEVGSSGSGSGGVMGEPGRTDFTTEQGGREEDELGEAKPFDIKPKNIKLLFAEKFV